VIHKELPADWPIEEDVYTEIESLLEKRPQYVKTLRGLLAAEEKDVRWALWKTQSPTGEGWDYIAGGIAPGRIPTLLQRGIIHRFVNTNSTKLYCLTHPAAVRRAIEEYEKPDEEKAKYQVVLPEIDVEMFSIIEGYSGIKDLFIRSLSNINPTNIMLVGPPASCKSLFLDEIELFVPNTRFIHAALTTKAGMAKMLYLERPFVCLIDEVEKAGEDMREALYTVLETGRIAIQQAGKQIDVRINCRFYVVANSTWRLVDSFEDRFSPLYLPEYTTEEAFGIMVSILTRRENIGYELARTISGALVDREIVNIREAVRVARYSNLARLKTDAEKEREVMAVINTLSKYKRR